MQALISSLEENSHYRSRKFIVMKRQMSKKSVFVLSVVVLDCLSRKELCRRKVVIVWEDNKSEYLYISVAGQ